MTEFAKEVLPINIEEEMKQSYMEYAMSVIVGRALPDVRDGLKPVHRRVLYAMHEQGNDYNKAHKKSARVVGDVMGKYHPHGDSSIYDTIVRMAQPFSLRYMLVDGQGNFGSVDGDSAAAMRYTEVRMKRIAHELLADLDKETVDFALNYDESESEPVVLPARFPNLLVNGSSGIAVGLATNIPAHNLREVINACIALIADADIDIEGLMQHMLGPDFPTAGIINGARGIYEAYHTGRGRIYVRARAEVQEESNGKERIIITELPYQVNKAVLQQKIAGLVKEKKIEGITEIRDESDKDGMRVVIELRRGESGDVVLNNLYQQTQLQNVFGINMVALVDGSPRLLNLKQILECFIRHRREVVTRRTVYELRKARERAHILEGLGIAIANLDEVIALIKGSASPAEAKQGLMKRTWSAADLTGMLQEAVSAAYTRPDDLADGLGLVDGGYRLSAAQAQAILDLRLHRLTGLEQDKIASEYKELIVKIKALLIILANPERLMEVIREELLAIRDQYGDERRTEIVTTHEDLSIGDLITEEDVVVTLSHSGYVKAQPVSTYTTQRRGGRGKAAASVKNEDFIDKLFVASTHDTILCFSSFGKVYWKKVYQLPQASRTARGRPIINLLPLAEDERITAVLPVREYDADHYIFMATEQGVVKKTPLTDFSRPRANGIIALRLNDGDHLIGADITSGVSDVMLTASGGRAIRFNEANVRPMGRTARGVRGIRMQPGERMISQIIVTEEGQVLTVTENGYGKRTDVSEYSPQGRGGRGVISIRTSERNGSVVGAILVTDADEIMLISNGGTLVRTAVDQISVLGRNTQGVRLIRVAEGEQLIGLEKVESLNDEGDEGHDDGGDEAVDADNDEGN
ncbi:MAG: DNA gyrase subunit A [Gammaproteobacteria bacterium]|nr:DNA gyrase subunit A [Gammaproteobacteria bacterium]